MPDCEWYLSKLLEPIREIALRVAVQRLAEIDAGQLEYPEGWD